MLHTFCRCPISTKTLRKVECSSRVPQVLLRSADLLTDALFAAQDVESVTACQSRVGTYMACSCDGGGPPWAAMLRKAKQ